MAGGNRSFLWTIQVTQPFGTHLTRRKFLDAFIGIGFVATAIGFLSPALAYLSPLKRSSELANTLEDPTGSPIDPEAVKEGAGVVGRLLGQPTLVIRSRGQLLGFIAVCSHLGCVVRWNSTSNQIECPCHGGRFDLVGSVTGGPPPEPLQVVALRALGNRIVRA